jgi:hypothetical protein
MTLERVCRNCEYFDHGTADATGYSDCLNRLSPRFQTYAHWTCEHFLPDTTDEGGAGAN